MKHLKYWTRWGISVQSYTETGPKTKLTSDSYEKNPFFMGRKQICPSPYRTQPWVTRGSKWIQNEDNLLNNVCKKVAVVRFKKVLSYILLVGTGIAHSRQKKKKQFYHIFLVISNLNEGDHSLGVKSKLPKTTNSKQHP